MLGAELAGTQKSFITQNIKFSCGLVICVIARIIKASFPRPKNLASKD